MHSWEINRKGREKGGKEESSKGQRELLGDRAVLWPGTESQRYNCLKSHRGSSGEHQIQIYTWTAKS